MAVNSTVCKEEWADEIIQRYSNIKSRSGSEASDLPAYLTRRTERTELKVTHTICIDGKEVSDEEWFSCR
jgi:hypothetical protein